ncbi:hypothetical protein PT974_09066 [Cladobotryum mycophilum]|uniref:Zn(2)-C6 fungal-type domain-containing protein n=1 Tax=Cladobotryum mycophilum TaxID=491253 RepID=A0ABR0SF55_9HYPO
MTMTRSPSQMDQENPRPSSSLSPEEEEVFSWLVDLTRFGEPFKPTSPLTDIINEIPSFIDALSLDRTGADLFRMTTPFHSEDEAVTTSDYSGQSPPDLIQGDSTSPSDQSGSPLPIHVDDLHHHYPDASLGEVRAHDDEWTYPQTDPSKSVGQGYPYHLQVHDDQTNKTLAPSTGLKRRRSGNDLEKRQRQLVDPNQTADVRKSGACLPCRVSKTRCHESGICPTCRKAFPDHSHLACTRSTPAMAWPVMGKVPDVWSTQAKEEEQLCSGPRFYTGNPKDISVFFAKDTASPPLRATVQGYRTQGATGEGSLNKADFPRDNVPSHQVLQTWVENQIRRENTPDFQHAVQSFLLAYSEEGWGLPKHSLVSKVHKMNCFFRIWKAPSFWCLDPSNKLTSLPLSVQAQLRNIARKGLYSLEHDILKELDDCLTQQGPPKPHERMAIWASMWQLILMYRELMGAFKTHLVHIARKNSEPAQTIASQTYIYKWIADSFFPLLTVFYHYQFRTKKSLEMSMDWLKAPSYPARACQSNAIHMHAQQLLDARKDLYVSLQSSKNDIDELLCVFVVNHELKKMSARRRIPKASTKSKQPAEDDCEDDAE